MAYEKLRSDRILTAHRKGNGSQIQMFGGGAAVTGNAAVYDADGNVIDGGVVPSGGSSVYIYVGSCIVTLATDYLVGDGHMHLLTGDGVTLPTSGDFWIVTPTSGAIDNVYRVTGVSGDDITVVCETAYGADQNHIVASPPTLQFALTFVGPTLDQLKADLMPTRATMWHDESLVTVGNAITRFHETSQNYGQYAAQTAAANGDTFTQSFLLAAGTYTLVIHGVTNTTFAKIDWYIDDTLVLSGQDWYASLAWNVVKTQASITVSGNGRHVLKGVVNGKNGSSSSYNIALTKIVFVPASDSGSV